MYCFRVSGLGGAGVVAGGRTRTEGVEHRIRLCWACAGMDRVCLGLRVGPGFPIRLRL